MLAALTADCLAWERLHSEEGGRMTAEELLEACRAAGYPEEAAQKAASERALQRMRLDLPP